ncbi:MAG: class I SAM-dependent methyltransferase [Alphaproteobacteria bacterium]|nr:class I SAM-dependent methyltransferase [Alphaproteobacteria bacterium]
MTIYDKLLTEDEFATFQPNAEVVRYLELTRERLGLQKYEMNVLDWGSGRGEYVAWLREAGYNALGAEIRGEAADRGKDLLQAHGHSFERVIAPIQPNGETTLPTGFFHFVFTHYVLEHVADIDKVTKEIARVTAPGGFGFHVYPGQLRPIEPHLFMPLVHWLPKNRLRKWTIAAFVACGIEPKWGWLNGASVGEKAQAYSAFVINETFYRSFREVRGSFNNVGFTVTPIVAEHPSLRRLAALPRGLRKIVVDLPVMLFQTVEILVRKPA